MGFWDDVRSTANKIKRNAPDISPITDACRRPYDIGLAAVTKIGNSVRTDGPQKLEEYLPDPDRRENIGRILTNIGKFAVESAVNESLKGVIVGKQLYEIVHEGLKDPPPSHSSDDKKKPEDPTPVMEEILAKMDKMQEDMNKIKQQNMMSTERVKGMEPLEKIPTERVNGDFLKTGAKRVMIRSRL